ncbi:hypothetical protein V2J09_021271 [Rumex salicifolius]
MKEWTCVMTFNDRTCQHCDDSLMTTTIITVDRSKTLTSQRR